MYVAGFETEYNTFMYIKKIYPTKYFSELKITK